MLIEDLISFDSSVFRVLWPDHFIWRWKNLWKRNSQWAHTEKGTICPAHPEDAWETHTGDFPLPHPHFWSNWVDHSLQPWLVLSPQGVSQGVAKTEEELQLEGQAQTACQEELLSENAGNSAEWNSAFTWEQGETLCLPVCIPQAPAFPPECETRPCHSLNRMPDITHIGYKSKYWRAVG